MLKIFAIGGALAVGGAGEYVRSIAREKYTQLESQILSAGAQGLSIINGTTINVGDLTPSQINSIKDAWIHTYVSGMLTKAVGPAGATIFDLNELNPRWVIDGPGGTNQDLWNNRESRTFSEGATSEADVIDRLLNSMRNGDLILDPATDTRTWTGTLITEAEAVSLDPIDLAQVFDETWLQFVGDATGDIISIGSWVADVINQFSAAETNSSPLVLDLDGDGIELTNLNSTGAVYWDGDADGFAESSGWVDGGDGILALDVNGNGQIDDSSELFGNATGQENGFLALKQYDSNGDNMITSADAIWDDLRIWVDASGEAISQAAELHTLNSINITSLNLTYSDVNITNDGNSILQQSTFVIDGNTRDMVDAWFATNRVNSLYDGITGFDLRTAVLPNVRGYGTLPMLSVAAGLDSSGSGNLYAQLSNFKIATLAYLFDDDNDVIDDIKDIMFRWAGVDGVSPTSRGDNIDARELGFLEKLVGEEYLQRGYYSNPYYWAAQDAKEAFNTALNNIAARLVLQTDSGDLFTGDWRYNPVTDSFEGITGLDSTALSSLVTLSGGASNLEIFWQNIVRTIEFSVGISSLSGGDQSALNTAINNSNPSLTLTGILNSLEWQSVAGVTLNGTSSNETLTGGAGNDTITGGYGNDTLNGGVGADKMYGQGDNDTLNGGTGADFMQGGFGNDTYNYALGDGTDTLIEEGSGTGNDGDKIRFGAGVDLGDLTFSRVGNYDLVIDIDTGSQTGRIVIEDQFNNSGSVELLDFNGASTYDLVNRSWTMHGTDGADTLYGVTSGGLTADTIYGEDGNDAIYSDTGADTVYGGDGDDYIEGDTGNDVLHGDAGNDTIYGEADNDDLSGGAGDDRLIGGTGADTYRYVSGKDVIEEVSSDTDVIILDAAWNGITPQYLRIGSDLRLYFDENNHITIKNHFSSYVETLQYANSTTVNLTTVSYVSQGTSGNDSLSGSSSANTMYGEAGNDSMYGYDGDDIMYGGDGNDSMQGGNHNDTLYGGAGNDNLYGQGGNNYYDGGAGDDYLEGGSGDDTFFYSSGYDRIYEYGGTDVLKITTGYDIDDFVAVRRKTGTSDFYDLRIEFSDTNYVMIDDYFNSSSRSVETLMLADLTTITLSSLTYISYGSSSADSFWGVYTGGSTNDIMYGLDGNDTLDGDAGNDILYGGNGNDTLYGEGGDDVYVFEAGLDIFDEYTAGTDTLRMTGTTTVDDITFTSVSSYDTKITVNSGVDEITVKNLRYSGSAYHIDLIEFSDGFKTTLPNYASWTNGTSGNDTQTGTSGADTILGKAGNDTIDGAGGNDALHGGVGNDTVKGGAGTDLVHGGAGDDNIYGQDGLDTLFGGSGSDKFVFESATAYNNIDVIKDFKLSENDKLDLVSLLTSYNPLTHAIEDFVQMTDSASSTALKVDRDGTGGTYTWQQIATIEGVTGLTDEAALKTSGNLITA